MWDVGIHEHHTEIVKRATFSAVGPWMSLKPQAKAEHVNQEPHLNHQDPPATQKESTSFIIHILGRLDTHNSGYAIVKLPKGRLCCRGS